MLHIASPSNGLEIGLPQILGRWQDAHALLMPMLSHYLDSAACLERAILHFNNQSDQSGLSQALACVDILLPPLDLGALQLHHAQSTLKNLRNQSAVLAPANRLPAEILTRIFTLATVCPFSMYSKDASQFIIGSLSSVCRYWRKVALGASSLWCHIDLAVGARRSPCTLYATKSLERAGSLPLQVHIQGRESSWSDEIRVVEFLSPHANRIVSLHLCLDTSIACTIIARLFKDLHRSSVRELHMVDYSDSLKRIAATEGYLFNTNSNLSGFLQSLTTLHLVGPLLNASSYAFHGLTELVLEPLDEFYWRDSDLTRALVSCPRLRLLALSNLNIFADESDPNGPSTMLPPPTAHLAYLEVLDLRGNGAEHAIAILSLIDTGSSALSLSLGLGLTPYAGEVIDDLFELQPFLHRSRVVRFCLHSDYSKAETLETLFSFLKEFLPLIEELAFQDNEDYNCCFTGLPSLRAEYFPRLHTLHFVGGILDGTALQLALLSSSIQEVHAIESHSNGLRWAQRTWRGIEIAARVSYFLCPPRVEGNPFYEWPTNIWPVV
ncbi:hypothetical protein BDV93DRAFT_518778 [Ceratobasidium sp. AG-I]|nr:hypothetical protein BDV93DRAFT_518778 [Ceratobasidium sp. AG-I]